MGKSMGSSLFSSVGPVQSCDALLTLSSTCETSYFNGQGPFRWARKHTPWSKIVSLAGLSVGKPLFTSGRPQFSWRQSRLFWVTLNDKLLFSRWQTAFFIVANCSFQGLTPIFTETAFFFFFWGIHQPLFSRWQTQLFSTRWQTALFTVANFFPYGGELPFLWGQTALFMVANCSLHGGKMFFFMGVNRSFLGGKLSLSWHLANPSLWSSTLLFQGGNLLALQNDIILKSWWWLFPGMQGFWENVQQFIPCLCFFFFLFLSGG